MIPGSRHPGRHWPAWLALLALVAGIAGAAPPTDESLRVAVHLGAMRETSRADLEVSLKVWAEELMRVLEVPAELTFYPAMPAIRRDLASGKVNFVIADGIDLLRHFQPDDLADGFGGQSPSEDKLLLLAHAGDGIRDLRDLAGRRVLLLGDNAISDLWLETACLRVFQKTCEKAGLIVVKESRSRQQILKLFFGKADGALVRGYAYEVAAELNPQIRARVRILERINIYPMALGLFGRGVSPAFRDYVIAKVPRLHDHPRGRQLLEVMQTERVGRVPHALLDPIRDLIAEHAALSQRYGVAGGRR